MHYENWRNFEQENMLKQYCPDYGKLDDPKAAKQKFWVDVFIVAEKLETQRLKDVALQKLEEALERDGFKLPHAVKKLYEGTGNNTLRRLVVERRWKIWPEEDEENFLPSLYLTS